MTDDTHKRLAEIRERQQKREGTWTTAEDITNTRDDNAWLLDLVEQQAMRLWNSQWRRYLLAL